jgi:hypothetical protein
MELEDLKSNWEQAGQQTKNRTDLEKMTEVRRHPQLRRIMLKLWVESILLILFLLTYQDAFDAVDKPLWLNIVLISTTLLYILSDLTGYWLIRNKVKGATLVSSLQKLLEAIKKVSVLSAVSAFFFGTGLTLFFSYNVNFNQTKYAILSGMIILFVMATWWSIRIWKNRISQISELLVQFGKT